MADQTLKLSVEGMSCEHCVREVKTSVGALAGVKDVAVELEKGSVTVGFDAGLVGLPAIKNAIEDQGYTVKEHGAPRPPHPRR